MRIQSILLKAAAATVLFTAVQSPVFAGVFDLPAFLDPGKFSVGIEPEVIISNPTGAGFNIKPRIGMLDILNWEVILGTGTGTHTFRGGLTADFEWFPDIEKQPGIATPITATYTQVDPNTGMFSVYMQPMVYKTFRGTQFSFDPFVAVPFGLNAVPGNTQPFVQAALGSMFIFPKVKWIRATLEAGFSITQSYTYISGGATFYP